MKTFLTAQWKNLLLANYEAEPSALKPFLPAGTEIDVWNNKCFVSLAGFMFPDTRVKGISFPMPKNFEKFNLRFQVRCKDGNEWKRGVVFVKEIVPKRMISAVAYLLYGEHYYRYPMRNVLIETPANLQVEYGFRFQKEWNFIKAEQIKKLLLQKQAAKKLLLQSIGVTQR